MIENDPWSYKFYYVITIKLRLNYVNYGLGVMSIYSLSVRKRYYSNYLDEIILKFNTGCQNKLETAW